MNDIAARTNVDGIPGALRDTITNYNGICACAIAMALSGMLS